MIVIVFVGPLYPQFIDPYTLSVPLVHPARKFTFTDVDVVVSVVPPPLIVAAPVTVHV
jgi:hypothetical protein